MQTLNATQTGAAARFFNVPLPLLAFILLSLLAHGLTLFPSSDTAMQISKARVGTTMISTVLSTAQDAPTAIPENNVSPAIPEKKVTTKIETPKELSLMATKPEAIQKTDTEPTPLAAQTLPATPSIKPATPRQPADKTLAHAERVAHQRDQQRNFLLGELQNQLHRYLTYPLRARRNGWQGEVMVAFHVSEGGQLRNIRLSKSSGYSLLDRSALNAIARLKQISLPDRLGNPQAMDLLLPVQYKLQES